MLIINCFLLQILSVLLQILSVLLQILSVRCTFTNLMQPFFATNIIGALHLYELDVTVFCYKYYRCCCTFTNLMQPFFATNIIGAATSIIGALHFYELDVTVFATNIIGALHLHRLCLPFNLHLPPLRGGSGWGFWSQSG